VEHSVVSLISIQLIGIYRIDICVELIVVNVELKATARDLKLLNEYPKYMIDELYTGSFLIERVTCYSSII
jgi:hypothetical protein